MRCNRIVIGLVWLSSLSGFARSSAQEVEADSDKPVVTLNQKADGYRGIWYMNQPLESEYRYKYSGGLGTYCAKHRPFAIYSEVCHRTFFCYGGAKPDDDRALVHMVSYFDHESGMLARPTVLLDKQTDDAHDNPVISMDDQGYLWIFSTSHGRSRPSYIHRSVRPYDIDEFQLVPATRRTQKGNAAIDNFSYFQIWRETGRKFHAFFTRYNYPVDRTLCYMNSQDGQEWSEWQRIAAIEKGHYQISNLGRDRIGTMFNVHPDGKGLNWRSNLYYVESRDRGESWCTVDGKPLSLPLVERENDALVHDFIKQEKLVYLKDLQYDAEDRPVMLYLVSGGYESGPQEPGRSWMITRWDGQTWKDSSITTSDNNYDSGELWLERPDQWWLIAPTEVGPQPFNPGGEVAIWQSLDQGQNWTKVKQLTRNSEKNHTYVRMVRGAHPDFVALWADGHGRQPSSSQLYFADRRGNVFQMPQSMDGKDFAKPVSVER